MSNWEAWEKWEAVNDKLKEYVIAERRLEIALRNLCAELGCPQVAYAYQLETLIAEKLKEAIND